MWPTCTTNACSVQIWDKYWPSDISNIRLIISWEMAGESQWLSARKICLPCYLISVKFSSVHLNWPEFHHMLIWDLAWFLPSLPAWREYLIKLLINMFENISSYQLTSSQFTLGKDQMEIHMDLLEIFSWLNKNPLTFKNEHFEINLRGST